MSFRKRRPGVTTATRLLFNGQRHQILASLALKPQLANSICFPGYCVFFAMSFARPQGWRNNFLVQISHESFPVPDVALVEMQLLLPKVSLAVIQLLIGCFDLATASLLQPHQRSQTLHLTLYSEAAV